jgi:hypothetical protein
MSRGSSHSHSQMHGFSFLGVFLALHFFHLNLHEVVQRARPSYNPRGTCPCWADTPATPGWARPQSRQFQALVERRRKCSQESHLHSLRCSLPCRGRGRGRGRRGHPVLGMAAVALVVVVVATRREHPTGRRQGFTSRRTKEEILLRGFLQLTLLQSWSWPPAGPPRHSTSSPCWTRKCLCLSEV